jgi:tRNA A37 threonylcarbamoyltransferase TsaD
MAVMIPERAATIVMSNVKALAKHNDRREMVIARGSIGAEKRVIETMIQPCIERTLRVLKTVSPLDSATNPAMIAARSAWQKEYARTMNPQATPSA